MAMSLPETTEQDHHEMVSFRVHGRIVATVPDDHHLRIMLGGPAAILGAIAENQNSVSPSIGEGDRPAS